MKAADEMVLLGRGGFEGLFQLCCRLYVRQFLVIVLLSVPLLLSQLLTPLILRDFIRVLKGEVSWTVTHLLSLVANSANLSSSSQGLLLALTIFLCSVTTVISIHHTFAQQLYLGQCVRLLLANLIYRKAVKLPRYTIHEKGPGLVINLISIDLIRIFQLLGIVHAFWVHPLMVAANIALLYYFVGPSAFAGLIAMVFTLGCGFCCTRYQAKARKAILTVTDSRVSLTNEILTGIRGVKTASLEDALKRKLEALRTKEVRLNRRIMFLGALSTFLGASAPVLAMSAIFLPKLLSGESLKAEDLFPTLAMLAAMRFALTIFPELVLNLLESRISLRRISDFLALTEVSGVLTAPQDAHAAIELKELQYDWRPSVAAVSIDSLRVARGELVSIIGPVGAGKSALLLGLIGEIPTTRGSSTIAGTVAYVGQQPWLISGTIRDNILSGQPLDEERLGRVTSLTALDRDLRDIPGGILAEIGERGITLSGGQRQRVALARAAYLDTDIVLLDDPLSALDSEVADHIFDNLILGEWRAKTRIIVTHRLEYARRTDRVLMMDCGALKADGSVNSAAIQSALSEASAPTFLAHDSPDSTPYTSDSRTQSAQRVIIEEEREVGAVSWRTLCAYLRVLAPSWIGISLLTVFLLRQIASVSLDLFWMKSTSENSASPSSQFAVFITLSLIVCALNLTRTTSLLMRGIAAGITAHQRLFKGVVRAPLSFFERNPIGRIVNRFSRDLDTVEMQLPRTLLDLAGCLGDVTTTILIVIFVQPVACLIIIPVLFAYVHLLRMFRPTSREVQRLDSITRSPYFAILSESLRGLETIRAFRLEEYFKHRFRAALDHNGRAFYSLVGPNRWLGIRLEFLGTLVILATALTACIEPPSPLHAALSAFAMSYALSITGAMNWMVRMLAQTENNLTSFERIQAYADTTPERWEGQAPPEVWPHSGSIAIADLTVRYRPELPATLKGITLSVAGGEKIGLIGRTGSGKSTFTSCLFRLMELERGHIVIDGVDIATIPLLSLRSTIALISQEPILFSGSIRNHLDPDGQFDDARLTASLERVGVRTLLSTPNPLDLTLIEGGNNISAGERQLLCLARCILKTPRILVLDEATAHVDPYCDEAIQRTLREDFADATQIIIAHRLDTIKHCDRLVILKHGEIQSIGTPSQLLGQVGDELSS